MPNSNDDGAFVAPGNPGALREVAEELAGGVDQTFDRWHETLVQGGREVPSELCPGRHAQEIDIRNQDGLAVQP